MRTADTQQTKARIAECGLELAARRGLKFTMDELAAELGMSKKTIYGHFRDKNDLLLTMVDRVFDRIKDSERAVLAQPGLSLTQRLRRVLGVMPECYTGLDFRETQLLEERYPEVYQRLRQRLESGWEMTHSLLREGMEQGLLRPVNLTVFQLTFEAALERFLTGNELSEAGMGYLEALGALVDLMMDGIILKEE